MIHIPCRVIILVFVLFGASSAYGTLIVDNDQGLPFYQDTFQGTDASYSATGARGATARISYSSATGARATWLFSVTENSTFRVSAVWPASDTIRVGFDTQAPFTVTDEVGPITVLMDQSTPSSSQIGADADGFLLLGEFEFVAGKTYSVVLTNSVPNRVIADAIKIEAVIPPPPPTQANAGPDQVIYTGMTKLSANMPEVGVGRWSIAQGGGILSSIADPSARIFNVPIGVSTFVWTITNESGVQSIDEMNITRLEYPIHADAGPNQTVAGATAVLNATPPEIGSGQWTVLAGTGILADPSNPSSEVSNLSKGINIFVWTVTLDTFSSQDRVSVTREALFSSEVSVVAGSGAYGDSGDGNDALAARFTANGVVVDSGNNFYIADGQASRVRCVTASNGIIDPFAGLKNSPGFSGDDGLAILAQLNVPCGLAVDWLDNIYITDRSNGRVRMVDARTHSITTWAGNGYADIGGNNGDGGPAIKAALGAPEDVAVDSSGNVYIADTRHNRIRKVDAQTGIISTVAGSGGWNTSDGGFGGDGGSATAALLNAPEGVAVDGDGNIYIADTGNDRVRRVDGHTGIIETFMSHPDVMDVEVDAGGNLYALSNCSLRRISPDASAQTISSTCNGASNLAADLHGNLFVSFNGYVIKKYTFIENTEPSIAILLPAEASQWVKEDHDLTFSASAVDQEDGDISHLIKWKSSIDGYFDTPEALSVGTHRITAIVTDSGGLVSTDERDILVTSRASSFDVPGLSCATFVDYENDGTFTSLNFSGIQEVKVENVEYISLYITKRVGLEFDISALRDDERIESAILEFDPVGLSNSIRVEAYAYEGDGGIELNDAYNGTLLAGAVLVDTIARHFFLDLTAIVQQYADAGIPVLGLNLRSGNENASSHVDEAVSFPGFHYDSDVFSSPRLTIAYPELISCPGDIDLDHDVDGFDLAAIAIGGVFEQVSEIADAFGNLNCNNRNETIGLERR